MPTITSGNVTLLDLTDTKKMDLHITSNHPTVQIYDKNNPQEPLTPDWQKNPLVLTPVVYIDSEPMKDYSSATFTWTKIVGVATNDNDGEFITNDKVLTRIDNEDLDNSPTIRYRCKIEYNNKSFFNEITFARIDNGVSAPTVQAQYSVDGTDGTWETGLDPAIHQYIHFSYDGGHSWTAPIKIVGEAGQSISLKGTAYTNDELVVNGVVVLYSDEVKQNQINGKNPGDSYLVDGYLCVYNGSQFICNGQLQGPKGDTYYLYIRYANDTNGSDFSETPGNRKYVGFYRSTVTPLPANIDKTSATWNWAKFAGEDAKSISLSANAQVFKIDKTNSITPTTITVTAQAINTTISSNDWTYSIDGGRTFSATAPTGVTRSGNTVTLTGASITSNSIVIKASDGTYSDFLTIYKVFDGSDGAPGGKGDSAPIVFLTNENISFAANAQGQITGTTVYCNIVAYTGTTQVIPTVGAILSTELPTGMSIGEITTVSNQVRIPIVIANNATLGSAQNVNGVINIPVTSPVSTTLQLTWSKINSGANGISASLVDITPSALYFKSTTGKNGTFTPEFIYLYPRFQNATYSNWQYSIDGGVNWVAASGANGLTISTYSSVANTLRISRASTLYTDTITSISFRCNSTTSGVYDTVSIGKLFDVDVEEINTRITDSLAEVKTTTDSIASRVSTTETSIASINNNVSSITTRVSAAEQKITPNAIVSTVRQSTDYTNDLGKKVNSTDVISTINQTAGSVTINANKIGLLGATNIPDLTADKIKGGTLTLGGNSATTQNGQILVKNSSDQNMMVINQYGVGITDGNLMIVDDAEFNDYGGWSSHSHTELKTTGIKSIYVGANSNSQFRAELDAITGLTLDSFGGVNANPYYFRIGPTMDDMSDLGTEMTFYENLVMKDGTNDNIIADISLNDVVLPKANIILQDTAQKNIQFQNASKELRACMLYAGANDSTTVMGAWDSTKSKSIFTYSTDNKFYILDSEAVTKSMMQSSVGERGYQKLPSGFIIQWGYQGSALTVSGNYNLTSGNITLPIAFPNSFTGVFCNIIEADDGSLSGYYNITAKANGLTGFTWKTYNYWNNWGSSILFSWMAIGY